MTIKPTFMARLATLILAFGALPDVAAMADGQAPASAVCIVPVLPPAGEAKAGVPSPTMKYVTQADIPKILPGMPSPLFELNDHPGRWIVGSDRRLVPYDGFWPVETYLDKGMQAREPWSSRTVAITYGSGDVSVLAKGAARFDKIVGSREISQKHGNFERPFVLPHRKQTVVTASDGAAFQVGDTALAPWKTPQDMRGYSGADFLNIHESRFLGGDVVLGSNGRLSILTDDDQWRDIVTLGKSDYGRIADAPRSGVAIFLGGYNAAVIWPKEGGGYGYWTVARNGEPNVSFNFYVSSLLGEAFYFGRSWWLDFKNPRWLRVTPAGFTEIEGASRVVLSDFLSSYRDLSVHDLGAIHRVLFQGHDGFYLYDGHSIVPIPNSGPDVVGLYPKFVDMPALGRAFVEGLVETSREKPVSGPSSVERREVIFEVTPDGRLQEVAIPPGVWDLQEWPQAHVGLVRSRDALFSLNPDLSFTRHVLPGAPDGTQINYVSAPNTETGDVLISSSDGLFLAVAGADCTRGARADAPVCSCASP